MPSEADDSYAGQREIGMRRGRGSSKMVSTTEVSYLIQPVMVPDLRPPIPPTFVDDISELKVGI